MELLDRLNDWFISHCDGDWEHGAGIRLSTLDNPGWRLEIEIPDDLYTDPSGFREIVSEWISDKDWIKIIISGGVYDGVGDPAKLRRIITTYLDLFGSHGITHAHDSSSR